MRERIGGGGARTPRRATTAVTPKAGSEPIEVSIKLHLKDDGHVEFRDQDGDPLDEALVRQAKHQQGDRIQRWLAQECDSINDQLRLLEAIHAETPSPDQTPTYLMKAFQAPAPEKPILKPLGLWGRVFRRVRERIEAQNRDARQAYAQALEDWHRQKAVFEETERTRKTLFEERVFTEVAAMEQVLEERLQAIRWPRETHVQIWMDVDLPEIEDLPTRTAAVAARGWKLSIKNLNDTQLRRLYMTHIHGICFRLIGEVFAALPTVDEIKVAGYSQRVNKATGVIADEYLYSVRVQRSNWSKINFRNLPALDPVEALAQFDLRRSMTKTGIFKPIDPHTLAAN